MNPNETEEILKKLQEINESLTEDNINKASKEELIKYLKQVDEFKALLLTASEENNK